MDKNRQARRVSHSRRWSPGLRATGRFARRHAVTLAYAVVVLALAFPAAASVLTGTSWDLGVPLIAASTVLLLGGTLVWSVSRPDFSLSGSAFWAWAFIFLGLAPAYQIAQNAFPWRGRFTASTVLTAQLVVLIGCAAACLTWVLVGKWRHERGSGRTTIPASNIAPRGTRSRRFSPIDYLMYAYAVLAVGFALLIGPELFTGKSLFQRRLAELEGVLGFGSLYFIATAGAVCIPAAGWVVWRLSRRVRLTSVVVASAAGLLATNPLIGSRFLTGAFLLAVIGAVLVATKWRRVVPLAVVLLFVTVFPSLDLARGDGTGSDHLQVFSPHSALIGFDFDAFEMLTRAVSVDGPVAAGEPSKWELFIAPLLRWVPFLARGVQGHATGPVVGRETGMSFTNVSMPLWGESYFVGGWALTIVTFLIVGALLGWIARETDAGLRFGALVDSAVAALLFMLLRGSLYEVLGYLLFALACGIAVATWLRWPELRTLRRRRDSSEAAV